MSNKILLFILVIMMLCVFLPMFLIASIGLWRDFRDMWTNDRAFSRACRDLNGFVLGKHCLAKALQEK